MTFIPLLLLLGLSYLVARIVADFIHTGKGDWGE